MTESQPTESQPTEPQPTEPLFTEPRSTEPRPADPAGPADPADRAQEGIEVRDNPGRSRFDILVDGEPAGFSMYTHPGEDTAGQRIFFHTVIDDAFGGRGLAGVLTRTALETSVAEGHRIVAVCPYVARWLRSHHEVDDAVDRVRPVHLEAARRAGAEGSTS